MSIRLSDFFDKDKEVDFTKVSFFDDIVRGLIEEVRPSDNFVVTIPREEYSENKKNTNNHRNTFSWEELIVKSPIQQFLDHNNSLERAS